MTYAPPGHGERQTVAERPDRVFSHPGQPEMQAEVILASQSKTTGAPPIFTLRLRYPRVIHGEIMTHRVFSRNARSSRAVPVKTMLNEVRTSPYVPWHWGKNQSGMQAAEECNELVRFNEMDKYLTVVDREKAWLKAAKVSADIAEGFMEAGYHKQNPNRLLEPFSWIDTLITSTDWDNFLWLRDHEAAEPHLQDLAALVRKALRYADVQPLDTDEWHLPYITQEDVLYAIEHMDSIIGFDDFLLKVSAARCARISYVPFDGDASYEKELARYDMLVTSDRVHASPTEHQAMPDDQSAFEVSQLLNTPDGAENSPFEVVEGWCNPELHGNLEGYIQARKLIPNEAYVYNNGVGVG